MNLTSLVTLLLIMVFYAWKAASESKEAGTSTLQQLIPSLKPGSGFRELLFFIAFLLCYKYSRYLAIGDESTAFANANWIMELEKSAGIFTEIPLQKLFLGNTSFIKALNQFYIKFHIPTTIIFFVWLFFKKKEHYRFIRNGFLIANIITIFFFIGFPCAPPRMFPQLGFVDTMLEISNVNLYKGNLSKLFNQYAAVPSMHFGNALLIAVVVFWLHDKKWVRWAILPYPWFVLFVIVVTGNHFYADAILGGIIVLLPYPLMILLEKRWPGLKKTFRSRYA